jgi:tetratricopeptide (TPR) repeat protein
MKPSSRAAGLIGLVLLGATWLWWICGHDNGIPFLPSAGPAEWIIYPTPPDPLPHAAVLVSTVFKRSFKLDSAPLASSLSIRCFKACSVSINGQTIRDFVLDASDWKRSHKIEITNLLRKGENEISVTVSNSIGPPALWVSLNCGRTLIASDSKWQASCVGGTWESAALAAARPVLRPGNLLYGLERTKDSLNRVWLQVLSILLVAIVLYAGVTYIFRGNAEFLRSKAVKRLESLVRTPAAALIFAVLLWVVLFCHNLPQLPPLVGFDRDGHLQYIDYILQKKALPLADEGWQMYQPPFFYIISALIISPFDSSASTDSSVMILRCLCAAISIVHVVMIFLCLRLLFPRQGYHQFVGVLVAGFLPANLCLAHNITNETLAAMFVTSALYFTLRSIRSAAPSPGFELAVGICLGLAMLTKFSALLAIPPICAALWWKARQWGVAGRQNSGAKGAKLWSVGLREVFLVLIACAFVCGWQYARVWVRFGNPLIGNWDPHLPFVWWQGPGYRTAGWYYRFGEAFVSPLFSNLYSFADGLYASFWGDGLCSGSAGTGFRPQWNYDLMNAGYLVALIPFVLLFVGLLVAIARLVRKPEIEVFLSVSFIALYGAGLIFMTLQVPSFAQVKAFYALPGLLPVCFLCVIGWDFLARRGGVWASVLTIGLVAWAFVVYAALLISPENPFTHTARGVGFADEKRYGEAAEEFSRALRLAPKDGDAHAGLLNSLIHSGNREEARRQAAVALEACPNDAGVEMQVGAVLGLDGKYEEAVAHFRRSIELAPDAPGPYLPLTTCLARLGKTNEVIDAAKEGLRVSPFNVDLHGAIAAAYAGIDDLTNQVAHLRVATELKTDAVETLNNLAWILASTANENIRNGAEAVKLAQRACELTQSREPVLLGTLAAAYAAAGRFKEAVQTSEQARDNATSAGQNEVAEKNRQLLELYRVGKAYREDASKP